MGLGKSEKNRWR